MKPEMKPKIPVLLCDLEMSWLIQRHKSNLKENPPCDMDPDVKWNELRINELRSSWDKA
jgi:hypothetical protein